MCDLVVGKCNLLRCDSRPQWWDRGKTLGGQGGVWSLEGGSLTCSMILEVCREEDSVYMLFGVFREGLSFGGGQCIIIFISVIVLNVFLGPATSIP